MEIEDTEDKILRSYPCGGEQRTKTLKIEFLWFCHLKKKGIIFEGEDNKNPVELSHRESMQEGENILLVMVQNWG